MPVRHTSVTRTVKSHTLIPSDVMVKYSGMNVKDFFKELRGAVKDNAAK